MVVRALTWNIPSVLVHQEEIVFGRDQSFISKQGVNKPRVEGRRPRSSRDRESHGSRTCGSILMTLEKVGILGGTVNSESTPRSGGILSQVRVAPSASRSDWGPKNLKSPFC
ncbi:hypothetical protein PoB_003432000 [Plakobranchus ocellatus]|uniref:Uncharacterized protein n=1 Tax=Plakobranchus ocellatus TaxID=259542 RepID=A0AAV4ALQ5_9GAST|nr:hypothetical protein PoB_003432000 [Plakobranchus ocellatus]